MKCTWKSQIPNHETTVIPAVRKFKRSGGTAMKKNIAVLLVIGLFSFAVLSHAADRDDAKTLVKRRLRM